MFSRTKLGSNWGSFAKGALDSKELWSGVLYISLGLATIFASLDYDFGGPSNMGPGFFPIILSMILIIIGVVVVVRNFVTVNRASQSRQGFINWKALILVPGSTTLFGLLLPYTGVLIALPALILTGAAASRHFRIEMRAIFGMLALSAACALVFVVGLGVPMPLLGSLFGG